MNSPTPVGLERSLETTLNQFPLSERRQALAELVQLAETGAIPLEKEIEAANMHCHTFYSLMPTVILLPGWPGWQKKPGWQY